ncbi:hypothetical protein BC829DRAFT_378340 [Chytridium lagenaria]|nr:hypothetical protein BC829DRAFT_378340 [Chytridium lagenaria]
MASMRDAMNRLQVILEQCVPEAIAAKQAELGLDEFQRLRKKVHADVRAEDLAHSVGTTPETAEASYRIRIMIKGLKESGTRMAEIIAKDTKKKKYAKEPEKLEERKEIQDLIMKHIDEVENLEKRRFNDNYALDRTELLTGAKQGPAGTGGHRGVGTYGGSNSAGPQSDPNNPFTTTELPDIDVEEDFKNINERNKAIDEDLEEIGAGVAKLKEIANAMGQELDDQNQELKDIDKAVNKALDHVDNVNISMRRALDGMMKGDKFMINCILICILLAILGFISRYTTGGAETAGEEC